MADNGNHFGGPVILTATFARLSPIKIGMRVITVRNGLSNASVDLGNASGQTGVLDTADSKSYYGLRPYDIWVRGTDGQTIFWDASGL